MKKTWEIIEELRKSKGLSKRKLAEATGISNSTIARIELGESVAPSINSLRKISKALDVGFITLLNMLYVEENNTV